MCLTLMQAADKFEIGQIHFVILHLYLQSITIASSSDVFENILNHVEQYGYWFNAITFRWTA